MNSEMKRSAYWDSLKFILISLVVYTHTISPFRYDSQFNTAIYNFVYLFHMPLFVFISGRFSHIKEKKHYINRTLKLVETYIVFQILFIVLSFVSVAGIQRQMRSNMLEVMNEDYIKFAIAKGLDENTIMFKYALRNAINPLITLLGFEFAGLLGGAALTEYIFQYPGLGRLVLDAVMRSDINLVMASLMIGTIMLVLGNLIADILLRLVDPRVRVN